MLGTRRPISVVRPLIVSKEINTWSHVLHFLVRRREVGSRSIDVRAIFLLPLSFQSFVRVVRESSLPT